MVKNNFSAPKLHIYYVDAEVVYRFALKYIMMALSLVFSFKPLRVNKLFNSKLSKLIKKLRNKNSYDYVLFDGFSTLQYADSLNYTHIYIDDEDITDLMMRRLSTTTNLFLKIFYFSEYLKCRLYEKKYLQRMTQVWAISPNTLSRLKKLSNSKSLLMPTYIPLHENSFNSNSKNIVFTGLLSWPENVNGLKWFLETCWSQILTESPNTTFFVVGQLAETNFIDYLNKYPNVVYCGYVKNLSEIYSQSALAIAPILINCGIKVKVLTYLSYGIPVVSTPESTWGLTTTKGILIGDKRSFASKVIKLLQNPSKRRLLSKEAQSNISTNHSLIALRRFFIRAGLIRRTTP
jgi:glycosyltransferase involved in cell wall biosynthesis